MEFKADENEKVSRIISLGYSAITASLYGDNNSQLIENRSFKGVDNLDTHFSVDTHSGIFALIVQCGKEIKVTKIIVSR